MIQEQPPRRKIFALSELAPGRNILLTEAIFAEIWLRDHGVYSPLIFRHKAASGQVGQLLDQLREEGKVRKLLLRHSPLSTIA